MIGEYRLPNPISLVLVRHSERPAHECSDVLPFLSLKMVGKAIMGTRLLFIVTFILSLGLGGLAAARGKGHGSHHLEDEITPASRELVSAVLRQLGERRDSLTPEQSTQLQEHFTALLRGLTLDHLTGKQSRSRAPLGGFLLAAARRAREGKSLEALEILFKAISLSQPGDSADSLIGAAIDLAAKARIDAAELLPALERVRDKMAHSRPTDLLAQAMLERVRETITNRRLPEEPIDPAAFPHAVSSGPEEEGALTIGSESEFSDTAEAFLHTPSKGEEEEETGAEKGKGPKGGLEREELHVGGGGLHPFGSKGLELTALSSSTGEGTGGSGMGGGPSESGSGIYGAGKMGSTGMYAFKRGMSSTGGGGSSSEPVFITDIDFDKPLPPFTDETEYLLYFEDLYRPVLRLVGEGYDLSRMLLERMIEMIEKCVKAFTNDRIFAYKDLKTFHNLPSSLYHLLAQRAMLKAKLAQRIVADGNVWERRAIPAYSIKGVLYVCALAIKTLGARDSTCNSMLESTYVLYEKNAAKSMKSDLLPDSVVRQIQDAFLEMGKRLETERYLIKAYQNQLLQQIYKNGRELEMSKRAGSLEPEVRPSISSTSTTTTASSTTAPSALPVGGLSAKATTGGGMVEKLQKLVDAGTPISLDGLTEDDYREIAKVERACSLLVLNTQPKSIHAYKKLLAKYLCSLPITRREVESLPRDDRQRAWSEVCGYHDRGALFWILVVAGVMSVGLVSGALYYYYYFRRHE